MTLIDKAAEVRKALAGGASLLATVVATGTLPEPYNLWAGTLLGVLGVLGIYQLPNAEAQKDPTTTTVSMGPAPELMNDPDAPPEDAVL